MFLWEHKIFVDSGKNKFETLKEKVGSTLSFRSVFKKRGFNQADLDKKLVYDLSSRKIPTGRQIKHLKKFLSPREFLIVRVCLAVIVINLIYLGYVFINHHLQPYPVSGGEYSEGLVGYPQTINPLYAVGGGVDSDLSRLIYSSLFVYNKNGVLSNDLAEKVSANASSTEYLIKIKDNLKWQDGQPLTADDIVFTLGLIQNPDFHSPLRPILSGVTATVVDRTTIKFVLTKPYAPFLDLLTFGILPKNLWQNVNPRAALTSNLDLRPIGSGPFKFKSLVKNSQGDIKDYYLTVNKNYYGRPPYLNTLDFKFYPDYQSAVKALNDNQIMGIGRIPYDLSGSLLAPDSLNFHDLTQPKIVALFFNETKNKSLADKKIRIALAQALNKKAIIKDVFGGLYQVINGPLLPQSYAYNQNITKYDYSPASSTVVFKAKPLSVVLTVIDSGDDVTVAQKIKDYWSQVGVKVDLRIVSGDQASNIIRNRDFEILLYGEYVGGDPDVYAFWDSSQIGTQGLNLSNYNNSQVDKLLRDARSTADQQLRVKDYKTFQNVIVNDLPAIFLYSPTYIYVQSNRLHGFSGTVLVSPSDRFDSIDNWYINTGRRLVK